MGLKGRNGPGLDGPFGDIGPGLDQMQENPALLGGMTVAAAFAWRGSKSWRFGTRASKPNSMEERERVLRALRSCDRRTFLKVAGATMGAVMAKGLMPPHTFQLVTVADAAIDKDSGATGTQGSRPFTFAYISDTHLYERTLNQRFVRAAVKAVEDVNALDPQPDFVLFGGDLAQLGSRSAARAGQADPGGAEGAGEDDGRRARLVPRPGREMAGACSARRITPSIGRACTSSCS